jgi:predicted PurR-regulated permease PerM
LAALVALVAEGPGDALIIVAAILVIQEIEGDVLAPFVLGRAVRLHPVVILLALASGAVVGGLIGAFLAVPIVAVAATTGNYLRTRPTVTTAT